LPLQLDSAVYTERVSKCHTYRYYYTTISFHVVVWLRRNALFWINVVALRWVWPVLGWVTLCRRVNNLGV